MFDFDINLKSGLSALMALFVLTTAVTGGALAISNDTETTTTPEASTYADGGTIEAFEASADNSTLFVASGLNDTSNAEMRVLDADGDIVFESTDYTEVDASTVEWNVSHDQLDDVPRTAGEQSNITVKYVGDTSADDPATTNYSLTVNATEDSDTLRFIGGEQAETDDVEFEERGMEVAGYDLGFSSDSFDFLNGKNTSTVSTTVPTSGAEIVLADDKVETRTTDALPSDIADGAPVMGLQVKYDDAHVPVFYNEAPSSDYEGDYAVYNADSTSITTTFADDTDASETDVTVESGDELSLIKSFDVFGVQEALGL